MQYSVTHQSGGQAMQCVYGEAELSPVAGLPLASTYRVTSVCPCRPHEIVEAGYRPTSESARIVLLVVKHSYMLRPLMR